MGNHMSTLSPIPLAEEHETKIQSTEMKQSNFVSQLLRWIM